MHSINFQYNPTNPINTNSTTPPSPIQAFAPLSVNTSQSSKPLKERKLNQHETDRLLDIIVETFPKGVNIKWSVVQKKFNDPAVTKNKLMATYEAYKRQKDTPQKRTNVKSFNAIINDYYGDNAHPKQIDWKLVAKTFKDQNNYQYNINTRVLREKYIERFEDTLPASAPKKSYFAKQRQILKPNPELFWTKARENLLVVVINDSLASNGHIFWKQVEWSFNQKFMNDGVSPYLELSVLVEKYEEILEKKKYVEEFVGEFLPDAATTSVLDTPKPFWTEERENQLLEITQRGNLSWREVEWLFNQKYMNEGISSYVELPDLIEKFEELMRKTVVTEPFSSTVITESSSSSELPLIVDPSKPKLFWTEERENQLLETIGVSLTPKGKISWQNVEWSFNQRFMNDGMSPYLERTELIEKYDELKKKRTKDG